MTWINAWLDRLPRATFGARTREVPAFRTIGVAGFYVAVLVTFASGLATGRSPVILAVVSVACGLSFFVWALVRRAIAGRESLSLFEHVWFALLCAAGVLAAFGEPVLGYLDPIALGLCAFLSIGRLGCLVVGCCHGQPSELGIRYGPELVNDGFPAWLVGVRLFPVQLVEAIGIAAIGMVGVALLFVAGPGTTFLWFLVGYAVLRFGMEGLRGDERRLIGGMSLPRWMAVTQGGVALAIADPGHFAGPAGVALATTVVLVLAAAAIWRRRSPDRAGFDPRVLSKVQAFVAEAAAGGSPRASGVASRSFPGGLSVAVSQPTTDDSTAHLSFALPPGRGNLFGLAELASSGVAPLPGHARFGPGGVLHVEARLDESVTASGLEERARLLYADALRSIDADERRPSEGEIPSEPVAIDRTAYFGATWGPRSGSQRTDEWAIVGRPHRERMG